jgi:hypothetical protein
MIAHQRHVFVHGRVLHNTVLFTELRRHVGADLLGLGVRDLHALPRLEPGLRALDELIDGLRTAGRAKGSHSNNQHGDRN